MTDGEKKLVERCRIRLTGPTRFSELASKELERTGFVDIEYLPPDSLTSERTEPGIFVDCGEGLDAGNIERLLPAILPFDFITCAGVIVLFQQDDREFFERPGLRLRAAEYMAGYCSFWNIEGHDRLAESLPLIKEDRTNEAAMKTAAYMSAKIAANIAVGRDVKRYPRFYLSRNLY